MGSSQNSSIQTPFLHQTLLLQSKYDWEAGGMGSDRVMLSYGPCQFPTLGLIVQRAWEIQVRMRD